MATILLSAAGAAIGGSIGGTALGLSMVAVGRLVGATLGRAIDQRLLGQGSEAVETGRVDRFRLTGSGEGEAITQLYGRMRIGGHVIWASDFNETVTVTRTGGGKGSPRVTQTSYSYSISLAIALCEGVITGVPRVWADGVEIAPADLNMRVHHGDAQQQPDPRIEAVEGAGQVPAYRGTAYVVIEDLPLARFGNRVPQFEFEVIRPDQRWHLARDPDPAHLVRAVAMMPGSGEYALADTPVSYVHGPGQARSANVNSPSGQPDLVTSLHRLQAEAPHARATSLIVSWFGDDLRCGDCTIRPKVEQRGVDGQGMPWTVSGLTRTAATEIAQLNGRPVYGGTPTDQSVIGAIRRLSAMGQAVMVYPFILMDQLAGNGRADPYGDATDQPVLPWRGRITGSQAPGRPGSPDGTALAEAEVAAFFGTAQAAHFNVAPGQVGYNGPQEWRYNRFILHHAALCAAAGGVDSFCIGSEMRGLTQLRGANNSFPAVTALRALAAQVRAILGPLVKIGYAADWSEYFGYQPTDGSGDRFFHLDPLWADANIDFVGIDNYMPLSDWREGRDHADAAWNTIYNPAYLRANIEGGEGYDWFYHSPEAKAAQIRTPITDDAHDEPWIWRYKDIRNWWLNAHHDRIGGQRSEQPTPWVPQSKPVWFTELGCPAVDKGTNQPNLFLDPKSSESFLPAYSNGQRDEVIQMQYLRAMLGYWREGDNNPVSAVYGAPMLDMTRAFVWAWDARPYPFFPGNQALWGDAPNYARGHWVTGRLSSRSLASVVAEICTRAGITALDTSRLHGLVRGYAVSQVSDARAALQPLMLAHGFDAVERDGTLRFVMRRDGVAQTVPLSALVDLPESPPRPQHSRAAEAAMTGRVRLRFVQADTDYPAISEESVLPDEATHAVAASELPLLLTRTEGRQIAERWLAEARIARDSLRLALPPSRLDLGAGDLLQLEGDVTGASYRIDRVELGSAQLIEALRVEPGVYLPAAIEDETPRTRPALAPLPVFPLFMDLPLMTGDELSHAPHVAVTADPWPGAAAVYAAVTPQGFALNRTVPQPAVIGVTLEALPAARPGLLHRQDAVTLRLTSGALSSIDLPTLLAGGNLAALGDGTPDRWELFQFANATLVGPDTWRLDTLLRGQLGSDALMPSAWPEGSFFVLMDGRPLQIDLPSDARGLLRHYRIGPAWRPLDDPSYVAMQDSFAGIGLKPLAPVHLRAAMTAGGDMDVTWIRRGRIDADAWEAPDIPMGEESERYQLRVMQGAAILREVTLSSPEWTYPAADRATDAQGGTIRIEVAQVSARFGPGFRAVLAPEG
ncbi:glycoside hydrolase/phage tail family protein [Seohaeicola saemankumensis]|uniref:baseplate multidomain protein megatron n=1 Tax=Seohaeicola TaxID=481178 RepID=UPI0035D0FEC8